MNPYGQPQPATPAVPAHSEQPKVSYNDYVKARSRLRWAFGYAFVSAVGNLVLSAFFALLTVDAAQHAVDQTKTVANAAVASGTMVFALALVVLGIFMMRRSRVAVGVAIGLGTVVALLTLIQALTTRTFLGITGVAIFLYLTSRAYDAVPTVRAYEARHPKR